MDADRKKEVLEKCIDTFVEKGPFETTVRDLSGALGLQAAGVLYWYPTKDDIVVACSEEIARRLNERLFLPALTDLMNGDCRAAVEEMRKKAEEMAPYMQFMTSVRAKERYFTRITDVLAAISEKNEAFVNNAANAIGCPYEEIAPYFYQLITTMTDYMLFHGGEYIDVQFNRIIRDVELIKLKYNFVGFNRTGADL